jgi:hypothetical protein
VPIFNLDLHKQIFQICLDRNEIIAAASEVFHIQEIIKEFQEGV